jgi:two-component system, response regulator YesN
MQKKWLYRLILSYLPIFIAVVFCLILVFFLTLNETTKRQTLQANRVFGGQVMQIVDATLQNVDTMASKGILLNEKVLSYYEPSDAMGTYDYYQVTNALLDYMTPLPMIDSVYLYRSSDGKVLMQSFSSELEAFGDKEFIRQAMGMEKPYLWSGIRSMVLFEGSDRNSGSQVVSLVKRVPYYSGEQGLIVINIRASSLQSLVQDMQIDGGARVCMTDRSGNGFAASNIACGSKGMDDITLVSAYSGLTVTLGLQRGGWVPLMSSFTYIWFIFGFIAVIGGIVAMTYISHRHYRPIEQLLNRVQTFGSRKNSLMKRTEDDDDFAFIDHALEALIEGTNSFEKQQAEGLLYRRMHFFKELVDGTQMLTRERLAVEAEKLGLSFSFESAVAGVVEIDYYEAFAAEYSTRDQSLFRFTIRSAIQEITVEEGELLWTEWVAPNRLGLLYWSSRPLQDQQSSRELPEILVNIAERARAWVEQYLKFTVTLGFGMPVREAGELSASYHQALAAADKKLAAGPNRVYRYTQAYGTDGGIRMDALLQELREAAQLFRLGNPDWERRFNRSFESMSAGEYSKEDITRIVQVFKAQIISEMNEAPAELQQVWEQEGLSRLQAVREHFEWIEEARRALLESLLEAGQRLQALRSNREQYSQAALVRQYIVDHYKDPNLSLAQISEAFDMNLKTLSRIFKEEFGEKFVDYLTKLRVDHAKAMLETTTDSVQSIAENVGYLYPMSFIRVFKKSEGMTPGDYRKEKDMRQKDNGSQQ